MREQICHHKLHAAVEIARARTPADLRFQMTLAGIALAAVQSLIGCDASKTPVDLDAAPVVTTKGSTRRADEAPGYVGVVAPRKTAVVVAETSARIQRVYVRMGDTVKKGDPIVSLDTKTIQDSLASAQAAAAAARASNQQASLELENSRRSHAVERRLNHQGVSSAEAVRTAEIGVRKAMASQAKMVAEARRAETEVDRLERVLGDATLKAPIDGVVSLLRAREGDMVTQGQNVVRVLAPGDWQLRFAVPSKEAVDLKKGARVQFRIDGNPGQPLFATVTQVAPELEPPLQLVVVEAEFDPDAARASVLRAGRVGRVQYLPAKQKNREGS
jgi:RND family efflux transporter MFP subunit